MSNFIDWYSNKELFNKVMTEIKSICGDRLEVFANRLYKAYENDEDNGWYFRNIASDLNILNQSILEGTMDYVFIIDCFENDGTFQPQYESFKEAIERIEKYTEIKY